MAKIRPSELKKGDVVWGLGHPTAMIGRDVTDKGFMIKFSDGSNLSYIPDGTYDDPIWDLIDVAALLERNRILETENRRLALIVLGVRDFAKKSIELLDQVKEK